MTPAPRFRRFSFAFGIAFAMLYVVALKFDLALFTVYPSIRVALLGTHHSRDSVGPSMGSFLPAMYWYGWTATAALGALVFGIGAALLPEKLVATVLVGMAVGRSCGSDARMRLPHDALVSTLVTNVFCWHVASCHRNTALAHFEGRADID